VLSASRTNTPALFLLCVVAGLQVWRWFDQRRADQVWNNLAQEGRRAAGTFDPSIVKDLPEPARRYFLFTISPGASVRTVSEISMIGEIGLGSRQAPNYVPMRAKQILAPPHGIPLGAYARCDPGCFGAMTFRGEPHGILVLVTVPLIFAAMLGTWYRLRNQPGWSRYRRYTLGTMILGIAFGVAMIPFVQGQHAGLLERISVGTASHFPAARARRYRHSAPTGAPRRCGSVGVWSARSRMPSALYTVVIIR
jgi:hypothetical protein